MAEQEVMPGAPHILPINLQACIILGATQVSLFCNKQKTTQAGQASPHCSAQDERIFATWYQVAKLESMHILWGSIACKPTCQNPFLF